MNSGPLPQHCWHGEQSYATNLFGKAITRLLGGQPVDFGGERFVFPYIQLVE